MRGRNLSCRSGPCAAHSHCKRQALERDMGSKSRNGSASRQAVKPASGQAADLGPMPIWNLADLYPGPRSKAVQADLKKAAAEAQRIKQRYQGKLAALA